MKENVLPTPKLLRAANCSTHEGDELVTDRQPESGTTVGSSRRGIPLGEGLEEGVQLIVGDPDA